MKAAELNIAELGDLMIRLPMIAQQFGHKSLEDTATYLHPDTPEAWYALDVIYGLASGQMSVEEFATKWWGSEREMRAALRLRFDSHHALAAEVPNAQ